MIIIQLDNLSEDAGRFELNEKTWTGDAELLEDIQSVSDDTYDRESLVANPDIEHMLAVGVLNFFGGNIIEHRPDVEPAVEGAVY
ncbi:unnamed protein product [marine sediment metagenome]|uniref:Uncharacterized protein n=1 Tax=marine sediment metagenome TaxID=412755 RepID=X0V7T8_9ZZZZ